MVQRVPVASVSRAASFERQVARRLGLRPQLDHRRGEADQVHRVQQMRVQHRLALLGHQRGDVAEAREVRRGGRVARRRDRRRAPAMATRAVAAGHLGHGGRRHWAAGAEWRCGRWLRRAAGEPAHQVAGRRQVGDVAEADQHHLGRGAAVGRGFHLADALQQHLPGARQRGHRQPVGQGGAAGAFGLGQLLAVAQRGHGFQAGQRVHQLQQVLQHHAEVGAAFIGAVGDRQGGGGLAAPSPPPSGRTPPAAVGQAQHVGDLRPR